MRQIVLFFALLITPLVCAAEYTPEEIPNPKKAGQENYVANPDGILADTTVVWLNHYAAQLEAETEVELCVVAIESIGDADAFDFSYELFQRWGIGKKGKNTGVLILFALESHDLRIMTGTGIEGVLTDAQCNRIIQDYMFPSFREGDFDGGICTGVAAIYTVCNDGEAPEELKAMQSVTNRGKYADEDDEEHWYNDLSTWFAIITIGIFLLIGLKPTRRRCPKCHKKKGKITRTKTLIAATYSSSGLAEETCVCQACGHQFIVQTTIPMLRRSSSSSGGGGFSGGSSSGSWGGGSTSGGGAGGKW